MFSKIYQLFFHTPEKIFNFLAIFGLVATLVLTYPIMLVFRGAGAEGGWELSQKILLFTITDFGPIELRFYAVCIFLGLVCGYLLALALAKIRGLADTVVDRLFVGLAFFGLIGARLFYVLFNLDSFQDNWIKILETYKGGLAIFGMLFFGAAYMGWYCWRYKFNFWLFGDFVAPAVLLGQIIGRFGNFFNYESYGIPTKVWWKMYVPDSANLDFIDEKYFHPTFLYEVIANYILLLLIMFNYTRLTKKHAGLVLAFYLVGYGLIRFFIEILRVDPLLLQIPSLPYLGQVDIRVSMVFAYLVFMLGLAIWFFRRRIYVQYQSITEIKLK
jgi:phosphatidylglycerol---prolipoprotein diacylglyceryl transferase